MRPSLGDLCSHVKKQEGGDTFTTHGDCVRGQAA